MNFLGVFMAPDLVEESWREVERKRELWRMIREQRAVRPCRFAPLVRCADA